ncbi:uncharacterized protein LOC126836515 [Adelges cooleyi]|uniref:uncharacterized protein LOC126836515 n=1 Tax=Adelges cooleyi TaxID=133065 RepID=UPI00218056A1|nr:uncharacterized protein LOC126836515 [Adelges cooleyi]
MNSGIESGRYNNVEEHDGETDNYVTCPLLQLKYSRQRKPITSRLGQKGRSLRHFNDNQPLFENKTAEADLGGSFQVQTPEKLAGDFKLLDLVHETPFVRPAVKPRNNSGVDTPSDTFDKHKRNTQISNYNFKPTLSLTTKRSLYSNKENFPEKTDEITTKCIVREDTCYASPETSKYNYDTSLYHSVRETNAIPDSSYSSLSGKNNETQSSDSSQLTKCGESQVDSLLVHSTLELSPAAKRNNFAIRARSPIRPVVFVQDGEFKRPVASSTNVCVKCLNENFICVKGINYSILNTLGHGGSSIVYEVLNPETNQVVAIKKVDLSEVEDIIAKGYLNEVDLLQNLQSCESVIRLFDSQYTTKEKILYMVMEKGDTDLSKLIRNTKRMSVHMIMYYWSEMLITVNEIHDKGIIHSDLKPANFLLVSGRLKLIDFGIASKIQGDMTSVLKDVTTGTWNYMSPECIRSGGSNFQGHKINQKSDVWSLGCILYSLIYGKTPYSHLTNTWQKLQAIAEPKQNISFPSNSKTFTQGIPPVLMQTMEMCLIKDVKARPNVDDLLRLVENTVFKPMT